MSNKLNEIKEIIENLGLTERFIVSDLRLIENDELHTISSVDYPQVNPLYYKPKTGTFGGNVAIHSQEEGEFFKLIQELDHRGFDVSEVEITDYLGVMDKLFYMYY